MTGYKPNRFCGECGDRCCCKAIPGASFPSDLNEVTIQTVLNMLLGGYCVDWRSYGWLNMPETQHLYIRPRVKGAEHVICHVEQDRNGGECVFLGKRGCVRTFNSRPTGCRFLKPRTNKKGFCHQKADYGEHKSSKAWHPYTKLVMRAVKLCEKKEGVVKWTKSH